ncbi:MAG: spore cortex biosynthesis protein YabQ [Pelosinus sp.]|nr:spore cortex biosynthesis protein YabQ [Pelosinus sp.]
MELASQAGIFVLTLATGAGLAVLFDVYRVIRRQCRFRTVLTYIGDFIYWVIATCIAFGMLLASNGGEIRLYVFIGLLSGAVLYYQLLSRYVIKSIMRMLRIAGGCLKYLFFVWQHIICKPLRWLLKVILAPARAASGVFGRIKNKIVK